MIISYFYLIENIKRRRRHDNTEEEKKEEEKTINIIQLINVHKKKPMIRFES